MKVEMRFDAGTGTVTIAELDFVPSSIDFFAELKSGVLEWKQGLSEGKHSLTLSAYVRSEEPEQLRLLKHVAELWNNDAELQLLDSVFVELMLGNNKDAWYGCSTAIDFKQKFEPRPHLQAFSYRELLEASEKELAAQAQAERERRRANPVQNPVKVPRRIASNIANYLRLEYGESRWSRSSLKTADLAFEGEFVIDGVPTQYWSYPTSKGKAWATVERFDDNYCLGMTDKGPPKSGES